MKRQANAPPPKVCIDDYLWALYERTPKIDTNKVVERVRVKVKVTIKKKNKTRTVTKTIIKTNIKYVLGDFTWKDPIAAKKAGMSLKDYVIGGMDPSFKLKLYRALRAMDDAGLMPGITSAFRDDYRQSIASGNKAASDSSYHGGSRRGGYGRGLAADLVSVKGDNRFQRYASSQELWKWIDAHEKELGIGRPYLDRDPPHVAPLDGAEYAAKRGRAIAQKGELQSQKRKRLAEVRLQAQAAPGDRAMDDAGFMPGITSAFRDDYRQSIASGNKAASDSSFHGGSRRGGYGHGLAVDLVSVKGKTRLQRFASAKSCGSGSMRTRRSLGSDAPIAIETPRMSGRSMARNMPLSACARLRRRANCANAWLNNAEQH